MEHSWKDIQITVATTLGGVATFMLMVLLVDPYSTGYFTPLDPVDVATDEPTFANAGRARNPRFNAAIVGNSRMMRLSPDELDRLTGLRFVSLAMPGIGPAEQIATARTFLQSHPGATIVWGAGHEWCEAKPPQRPFPFWLYEGRASYLWNVFGERETFRITARRIKMLLGVSPPKGPVNGFEPDHPWWKRQAQPDANSPRPVDAEPLEAPMPAVADLAGLELRNVLFVIPPMFAALPVLNSPAAKRKDLCDQRLGRIGPVLDLLDIPSARDPANFVDRGHFRNNVARDVEQAISEAINRPLRAASRAVP